MIIGVPKEIKQQENRVSMLPSTVYQLVKHGHRVLVERNAGAGSGYPTRITKKAGATMLTEHAEVFALADLITKVKEPLPEEYALLRRGQLLFTYLHLAANRPLTEALAASGATCIAYETIEVNKRLPLLEPMSEIAGRMSIIVGGYFLAKHAGGSGVLLGGVPGVLPGRVVVLGGGTSGVNAARMATGLGADVTILEVDLERMRFLDITMHSAHTLFSSEAHLVSLLATVDLLIGAVLVPGARAPKLITRDMLRQMRPGSVLVDIAIDQGGCAETARPTTHHDPVYVEEGITHYCVANMPGAYARTATQALTNVTARYIEMLADLGLKDAIAKQPALLGGINVCDGRITQQAVAEAPRDGLPRPGHVTLAAPPAEMRRPARSPKPAPVADHHHHVYVVLLDPRVADHPSIQRLNPRRDPAKPCVYVGMTGLDPTERFANHKLGHKASWVVQKYGLRLLPELYECFNPMPFQAALEMEAGLADDLRTEGYTVTGGH